MYVSILGSSFVKERNELSKMKIIVVYGTRPEAIKMAPLVNELKSRNDMVEVIVVSTGQHRDMLKQVEEAFDIIPDYDLDIMKTSQKLSDITCAVIKGMEDILLSVHPDIVLVHGDTSTSFAAAVSCFYNHVPIGHVEAGLRTHNLQSPWPEEFNRTVIDLVAQYYFAPTEASKNNLLNEGVDECKIWITGNTGIDALQTTVRDDYSHVDLDWADDSRLILITAHRRENLGDPMHHMFRAIRRVLEENPDTKAIYPIHMNPQVREAAKTEFGDFDRIRIIEPLDVFDFHNFLKRSHIILTDSGGIQEEAPSLGKPVLVMRDTTERPEGVEAGTLKLVGVEEDNIYREFSKLLNDSRAYDQMSMASNPYGDGTASKQIADVLVAGIDKCTR